MTHPILDGGEVKQISPAGVGMDLSLDVPLRLVNLGYEVDEPLTAMLIGFVRGPKGLDRRFGGGLLDTLDLLLFILFGLGMSPEEHGEEAGARGRCCAGSSSLPHRMPIIAARKWGCVKGSTGWNVHDIPKWSGKNSGMARQAGRSGASARSLADRRRNKINVLMLAVLGIGAVCLLLLRSGLGLVGILVLLVAFKMVMRVMEDSLRAERKRERQALRGAKGEDRLADLLDDLPDDHCVFHDIDTGSGDIDHVVVTPEGGVFVIETKAHGGNVTFENGTMLINGRPPEKNFIGQVLRNAYWLKDEIKRQTGKEVWVNAALVFANAFVAGHRPIKGVSVMNRKFLGKFIASNRPKRPDPHLVSQLQFSHAE